MSELRKYIIHLVLWAGYSTLVFFIFQNRPGTGETVLFTLTISGLSVFAFYINYGLLIPRFYLNGRMGAFVLCVCLMVLVSIFVGQSLRPTRVMPPMGMGKPDLQGIPEAQIERKRLPTRVPNITTFFHLWRLLPFVAPTVVFLLVSSVIKVSEHAKLKEQETVKLKAENYRSELKFLRLQINPHFLFNSLNNIYALSVAKSDQTPDTIVKLSNMLRYVIYECNVEKVSFQKEINYIKDYIDLQKLKDKEITNIQFSYPTTGLDFKISPMLFIPFIENAFKHSKIEDVSSGWIDIEISLPESGKLRFRAMNSLPEKPHEKDETEGIGIENVRKRLNLLYPGKHELVISEGDYCYEVQLNLDLAQ